ncbi:MAG: putative molybdenum carrier protein [Nitrospira sp.]
MKIISGAQTGADRAGLEWAKANGFPTGGWMPNGFRAEDGNHPEFAELYGIKCISSRSYRRRTERNVVSSDGTIIFGNVNSPGSRLTLQYCVGHKRPSLLIPYSYGHAPAWSIYCDMFVQSVSHIHTRTINIAGNRESKNPGISNFVKAWLDMFREKIDA